MNAAPADVVTPRHLSLQVEALPRRLRLGTRRSHLATTQSQWVATRLIAALAALGVELEVELVEVTTKGDITKAPLASLGGTGVFVSALRDALADGKVDLAVHSLKDLPTQPADGISLVVPLREDARDVLVARDGLTLAELPSGARVGTGSPRRAAQIRALGLGHEVVEIRGNVDTRLGKVASGEVDAVVLALAGLRRIGRDGEVTELLDPLQMLPAPGQGALAIECRSGDRALAEALLLLQDDDTLACVLAERSLLARLEAGCAAPVGALAEVVEGDIGLELSLRGMVGSVDGAISLRRSIVVPLEPDIPTAAVAAGIALAELMLEDGAAELLPLPSGDAAGSSSPSPESSQHQAREGDPVSDEGANELAQGGLAARDEL